MKFGKKLSTQVRLKKKQSKNRAINRKHQNKVYWWWKNKVPTFHDFMFQIWNMFWIFLECDVGYFLIFHFISLSNRLTYKKEKINMILKKLVENTWNLGPLSWSFMMLLLIFMQLFSGLSSHYNVILKFRSLKRIFISFLLCLVNWSYTFRTLHFKR